MKGNINNHTYDEHFLHGGDKGNYTGWAVYHTLSGEHVAAYYYENGLVEKLRLMRGSAPLIGNASYGVNVMFIDSNGETKATPRMKEVEADEVTVVGHKPFEDHDFERPDPHYPSDPNTGNNDYSGGGGGGGGGTGSSLNQSQMTTISNLKNRFQNDCMSKGIMHIANSVDFVADQSVSQAEYHLNTNTIHINPDRFNNSSETTIDLIHELYHAYQGADHIRNVGQAAAELETNIFVILYLVENQARGSACPIDIWGINITPNVLDAEELFNNVKQLTNNGTKKLTIDNYNILFNRYINAFEDRYGSRTVKNSSKISNALFSGSCHQ